MALQKVPGKMIELASQANSDVIYFDGTEWVRLAKGEPGDILTVNESETAPQWDVGCVLPGVAHGYVCGGFVGKTGTAPSWGPAVYGKMIEKFSLTTDGNAADVADILTTRRGPRGCSSATHGYVFGGGLDVPGSFLNSI